MCKAINGNFMYSIKSFMYFAAKISNVADYECTVRPRVSTTKSHTRK